MPVSSLDRATIDAAFSLFDSLYAGTDRARFERDLHDKQLVILLRDAGDHILRGFSTIHLGEVAYGRRRARLVYSGDTAIHPAYWGQKCLQRAFATVLMREKLRHPSRPLLWFLISKGYKTYLLLVNHFPRSLPRSGRPAPARLQETLSAVAGERFGDAFDPVRGVISYGTPRERVRHEVAPIDRPLLRDAHVAFFVTRNPGYQRGDELACLAEVRAIDPVRIFVRSWWRARVRRGFG
ncbi:MAG: hypothetical protein ABR613_11075 [Actinomycetota bacterium]